MQNLCKTCAHHEPCKKHETGHSQGLGRCNAVPMLWEATKWDENGDERILINPEQKAFVQDGSDYSATFYTMPDFGCVQHKEK
jgi:hypothetical protein